MEQLVRMVAEDANIDRRKARCDVRLETKLRRAAERAEDPETLLGREIGLLKD